MSLKRKQRIRWQKKTKNTMTKRKKKQMKELEKRLITSRSYLILSLKDVMFCVLACLRDTDMMFYSFLWKLFYYSSIFSILVFLACSTCCWCSRDWRRLLPFFNLRWHKCHFFSFCFTTPSGCAFSVRFINAESEIGASGSSSGWLSFFRYLAPTTLQKTWICFPPAGCLITPQTGLSCFDRATDLAEGKLWMPNLLNDGIDCCR